MGFFTLELARLVGASGRVVALDIQSKMLDRLKQRLAKAGLLERVNICLVQADTLGLANLTGSVDFALAFAVVHEMPSASSFFTELSRSLKPGGFLLLAEPAGHVKDEEFDAEPEAGSQAGPFVADRPKIRRSHTALPKKGMAYSFWGQPCPWPSRLRSNQHHSCERIIAVYGPIPTLPPYGIPSLPGPLAVVS
jgi:SAM-dependent methyltransferase